MPGGPNPERIYDAAEQLLTAVVVHHGGALPARRYVSAGAPVWDCELVAVHATGGFPTEGPVGTVASQPNMRGAGFALESAQFGITIVRCTPAVPESKGAQVKLPTVEAEQAAALALYTDVQRVKNALVVAAKAGELPGCSSLVFEQWTTEGPEGGMVATVRLVRVGLALGVGV